MPGPLAPAPAPLSSTGPAPWKPIYRQVRDRVVAMVLDGVLAEGDPLPSVRTAAADYRINPITVLKGYQHLVDEEIVEKKRGRGISVRVGAR